MIKGGNEISKNEGADVWFVGRNADGITPDYTSALSPQFLNLYWGLSSDGCSEAAIQTIIVTKENATGNIKSYRYAYDSCFSRRSENNFTPAESGTFPLGGMTFNNKTNANNLASGINGNNEKIILMRVIPIYKDAVIGIYTCNNGGGNCTALPSQGYVVSSTGTSGQANRKIITFKGYPQNYLSYLSYGLFVAN